MVLRKVAEKQLPDVGMHRSTGYHAIRNVPRQRPGSLRRQEKVFERIIEDLVRPSPRVDVADHQVPSFLKRPPKGNLNRTISISAAVVELQAPPERIGRDIFIDQSVALSAF